MSLSFPMIFQMTMFFSVCGKFDMWWGTDNFTVNSQNKIRIGFYTHWVDSNPIAKQ